jgi:hypothetical protein
VPPSRLLVLLVWVFLSVTITSTILWISLQALPLQPSPQSGQCPVVALASKACKSDVDDAVPLPLACAARDA